MKMSYSDPIHFDWHSVEATLQPIQAFQIDLIRPLATAT